MEYLQDAITIAAAILGWELGKRLSWFRFRLWLFRRGIIGELRVSNRDLDELRRNG